MMTTLSTIEPHSGSATIYQFPVGGRGGRDSFNQRQAERKVVSSHADVALTDAWYHQDAISEAKPAIKQ